MRDIPIIYSGPMIRAMLREVEKPGTGKTMTRRLAWRMAKKFVRNSKTAYRRPYPRAKFWEIATPWHTVQPGDRLWVRETAMTAIDAGGDDWRYAADYDDEGIEGMAELQPWRPSIHMPRVASRLTLIVTGKKIEPLNAISEADAKAEGTELGGMVRGLMFWHASHRASFSALWNMLHGPDAWDANPEVVAITFTVHKCNIDAMSKAEAA